MRVRREFAHAVALGEFTVAETEFLANGPHRFRTQLMLMLGPTEQELVESDGSPTTEIRHLELAPGFLGARGPGCALGSRAGGWRRRFSACATCARLLVTAPWRRCRRGSVVVWSLRFAS